MASFSAGSMRPVASVYIDQHNWTLLSSQNWSRRLVNQVMPTDYNAMYRSVADKLQNQTIGREPTAAPNELRAITAWDGCCRYAAAVLARCCSCGPGPTTALDSCRSWVCGVGPLL